MLVVIAIFLIFTAIMLANYKDFGENEKFVNFVYDTALALRQTQTSGIAVKESTAGSQNYGGGYGIHFSPSTDPHDYIEFIDQRDDSSIVVGGGGEGVYDRYFDTSDLPADGSFSNSGFDDWSQIPFDSTYTISQICVLGGTNNRCANAQNGASVDILFMRPEPLATITYDIQPYGTLNLNLENDYTSAVITLQGPHGLTKTITVNHTGQISVQ